MNFVGAVTRYPRAGALPLCKAANTQLYVDGAGLGIFENEAFIPAWLIPQASEEDARDPGVVVMKVAQQE
eukprot:5334505-Alexandrium_andersonii.AAC.1